MYLTLMTFVEFLLYRLLPTMGSRPKRLVSVTLTMFVFLCIAALTVGCGGQCGGGSTGGCRAG